MTHAEAKKLAKRALQMRVEHGLTWNELADTFNREGIKPTKLSAWDGRNVYQLCHRWRSGIRLTSRRKEISQEKTAPETNQPVSTSGVLSAIEQVIKLGISDKAKAAAIKGILSSEEI